MSPLHPNRFNVVPDRLDLRDRLYQPAVNRRPLPVLEPPKGLPILDQGQTNACTGFSLATVIHGLQARASGEGFSRVSPLMLYAMARRYDEFQGSTEDTGSSLRGGMKGWYKHGACEEAFWPTTSTARIPKPSSNPAKDWRREAAQRPLGAYYRVDTRSVTDMQVALNEAGVLYASAQCHAGWDKPTGPSGPLKLSQIPFPTGATLGGHAFALVGYTPDGFIVQNSWGKDWGTGGLAVLTYEDWLEHAMDCWVAQLGAVTHQHEVVKATASLRSADGKARLASDLRLRNRELDPFILDMGNNGRLSQSGEFKTTRDDLKALVDIHIPAARKAWGLGPNEPLDIALYAHGGLTGETDAASTAAEWIPALYDQKIFPIFFMWETDAWSTIKNRLEDLTRGQILPAGGFRDSLQRWWNERLEGLFSQAGSLLWSEMKQNADAISGSSESGARLLYELFEEAGMLKPKQARFHLIGHSAGSIVHCYLAQRMAEAADCRFGTVAFMAPAVTVKLFRETLLPLIQQGKVDRYHQFHLSDEVERQDPTCKALLGYSRSLLYLVSRAFEGGGEVPILGMERHFEELRRGLGSKFGKSLESSVAPGKDSTSSTHGGFDEDAATRNSLIQMIRPAKG